MIRRRTAEEELSPEQIARNTYPWLFTEPDANELVRLIAEAAHRALTTTTLPAGYGPAPNGTRD